MKKYFFILGSLITFSYSLKGQENKNYQIVGQLTDCYDNSDLSFIEVKLLLGGQVINSINSDFKGEFIFKGLKKRIYNLIVNDVLGSRDTIINVEESINLNLCLGEILPDSILEFNSDVAQIDIKNGDLKYKMIGIPIFGNKYLDDFTKKYNLHIDWVGDVVTRNLNQSCDSYNKIVVSYMDKKIGNIWRQELDSALYKALFSK